MSEKRAVRAIVEIDYTNWRGERSMRRIVPMNATLRFGSCQPWHHQEQWLIDAWDIEKDTIRTFAMKDVHSWTPALEPTP